MNPSEETPEQEENKASEISPNKSNDSKGKASFYLIFSFWRNSIHFSCLISRALCFFTEKIFAFYYSFLSTFVYLVLSIKATYIVS